MFAAGFKPCLEPLTGMERDDAARRNERRAAGFRIASGTLRFVT